jgi:ABC-type transport system involved in multi-copper enzyme maturation permease subunit
MKAQYKALIIDTMLKEVRSKTLIFIFVATTLAIILGHLVLKMISTQMGGDLSITGINPLTINFRILNSISFIIAAIFGVSVFRSDFQNNIIYQYLSFPISRTEYFFIRVIGTWLLVLTYYAYSYILSSVLFSWAFNKIIFTPAYLLGFFVLCLYLLLVIFIATLFSLIMNKMGAIFMTFATSMAAAASFMTFSVTPYNELLKNMSGLRAIGLVFYFFFPRFTFLDKMSNSILFGEASGLVVWEQCLHLVLISAVYIYIANYIVKRKDF